MRVCGATFCARLMLNAAQNRTRRFGGECTVRLPSSSIHSTAGFAFVEVTCVVGCDFAVDAINSSLCGCSSRDTAKPVTKQSMGNVSHNF